MINARFMAADTETTPIKVLDGRFDAEQKLMYTRELLMSGGHLDIICDHSSPDKAYEMSSNPFSSLYCSHWAIISTSRSGC